MGAINYDDLVAFTLVCFALTGSPGPATLCLVATGAAYGFQAGRNFLLGVILGVIIVIVSIGAGVFAALTTIPKAAEILTAFAAIYIVYLAFRIATAAPVGNSATITAAPGFAAGFILNISNPKAYAAFAALFSGFQIIPDAPTQSVVLQGLIGFSVILIVNPAWLYIGSTLRNVLRNERMSRIINLVFAALLVVSVLLTVLL